MLPQSSTTTLSEGLAICGPFTDTFDYDQGIQGWTASGSGGSFTLGTGPHGGKAARLQVNGGPFVLKRRFANANTVSFKLRHDGFSTGFPLPLGQSRTLSVALVAKGVTVATLTLGATSASADPVANVLGWGYGAALSGPGFQSMGVGYKPGNGSSIWAFAYVDQDTSMPTTTFHAAPHPEYDGGCEVPDNFVVINGSSTGTSFDVWFEDIQLLNYL